MSGFESLIELARGSRSADGVGALELHDTLVEARNDPRRPNLGEMVGLLDGAIAMSRALPGFPPPAIPEVRHHLFELVKILGRAATGEFDPAPERAVEPAPEVEPAAPEEPVEERAGAYRAVEDGNAIVLGEILSQLGFVSPEEVSLAVNAQASTGKRMGEILIETGMISVGDLKTALNLQQHLARNTLVEARTGKLVDEWHLGRILLRSGVIDEATLDRALDLQLQSGLRIGEALVELSAATWDQISEAVRIQSQERRRRA